ncbi:MAG: DNA-binding protein [Crenarchaeota archaeon]|nr:DNA-binding protein [Thermoproteota archaeon]
MLAEDEELESLMLRRRQQLEQEMRRKAAEERRVQAELQRESILRQILSSEARERLTRLKMVRPQFARVVEDHLIALAQAGRIQSIITDDQLKEILKQLLKHFSAGSGKVEIRRK